jgi:hypothetical protein
MSSENKYLNNILDALKSMDIDKLRFYLKDEYSYQDTSKDIFLEKIEELFIKFKNAGDTQLIIHPGICGSDPNECNNCGKRGYLFGGDVSGHNTSLIFEISGDDIHDIYYCHRFMPDESIKNLADSSMIFVSKDEEINFDSTPEYWAKVSDAQNAYEEILSSPNKIAIFEKVCYWLDKNQFIYKRIDAEDIFSPRMRWTPFTELYRDLQEIRVYIQKFQDSFKVALENLPLKTDRKSILEWLNIYEKAHAEAPFGIVFGSDKYLSILLNKGEKLYLKGSEFEHTLKFINTYKSYYSQFFE